MTAPTSSELAAIAEIVRWAYRVTLMDHYRTLPGGRRQPIIPTEIPDAIVKGEIEVPAELVEKLRALSRLPPSLHGGFMRADEYSE